MQNELEIYTSIFTNTMNFINCKQNGMTNTVIILKKKMSFILLVNSKNLMQNTINTSRVLKNQKEETIKLVKIIKMSQI